MSLLSHPEPVAAVLQRPHSLLEGPRIGPGGELVYSDAIAGGLWSCSPEGAVRELLPRRRGIGGVLPHADGGWVVSGRTVVHLAADGTQRELLCDPEAPGYNDLSTTPDGGLLAGELRYRPMSDEQPREGRLLMLARDGHLRTVCEGVLWPNGIGLSPDGTAVYVSDYARRVVLRCPLQGGDGEVFAPSPRGSADGLAVDAEGGVWVALGEGGGVARFDAAGRLDELVEVPAGFVSSIAFGGADMRDVLISTADNRERPELGGTLLTARSEVPGVVVAPVGV